MRNFTITQSNRNGVTTKTIKADGFLEREEDGSYIFFTRTHNDIYAITTSNRRVGLFYDVEEITSEEIEKDSEEAKESIFSKGDN